MGVVDTARIVGVSGGHGLCLAASSCGAHFCHRQLASSRCVTRVRTRAVAPNQCVSPLQPDPDPSSTHSPCPVLTGALQEWNCLLPPVPAQEKQQLQQLELHSSTQPIHPPNQPIPCCGLAAYVLVYIYRVARAVSAAYDVVYVLAGASSWLRLRFNYSNSDIRGLARMVTCHVVLSASKSLSSHTWAFA